MADITMTTAPWPSEMMESYSGIDEHFMGLKGTVKEFQPAWQAFKYLLGGKMYAYIGVQDKNLRPILTMKLDPDYSDVMRNEYTDIVPGYYMNKIHWSTVYLDGQVPQDVICEMASLSYNVMLSSLSKKAQMEILGM